MSKYKTKNHVFIIGSLILFLFPVMLWSQNTETTEEITIVGEFNPKIDKANKLLINPKIKNEQINLPVLSYQLKPIKFNSWFVPNAIAPANIRREKQSKLYRNYIKAGFGNYTTPYLEFAATNLRSDDYAFGVHLKHLSSAGNIKEYAHSAYSSNQANIFGKKFYKNGTLSGKVYYDRNVLHKYGYKPADFLTDSLTDSDIRQRFQEAGAQILYNSNHMQTGKLNHSFGLNYYYYNDLFQTSEQNVNILAKLDNTFKFSKLTEQQKIGLLIEGDYYNNTDSLNAFNKGLIRFSPYLQTYLDQYFFYVGFNAIAEIDTVADFHLYPEIKAGVEIVPDALIASVGISGSYDKNTYKQLTHINPYLNSIIPITYQNKKIEVYGQLKGKLFQGLDFDITVSNSSIVDAPLFVNDTSTVFQNTFTIITDKMSVMHARATLGYQIKESARILLKANYYSYSPETELEAWHKPNYDISFGAKVAVRKMIYIRGEIIAYGKSFGKTYAGNLVVPKEIDSWIDLNLGVEYRYTKSLSIFADFNNVSNSQYMIWNNYPVQKFSFLAGLSYSF